MGAEYWSGVNRFTPTQNNAWQRAEKGITLPPGTYIMGYLVRTACKNSIYIDTRIDTLSLDLGLYEKALLLPPGACSNADGTTNRTMSNVMMMHHSVQTTLYFWCYMSIVAPLDYEIWAVRLK